ncbi:MULTISPECIES: replication initiation factor domain-containing protein [Luteibacter]|uniref:replication initiation factor domain-containing protein n=2 Tax=Rhodanobacteraceae TaxID=1775411 RepID=UPI00068BF365|nr:MULTISPECIES: replication initiation factor domain-containing protein [unclassified Luteibacter]
MIRREAPVIPSANRGSKYLNAKKALPTKRSQVAANIDFLRFSAGAGYVFGSETEGDAMIWSAERFVRTLAPKSGIHVEPAMKGGRRGYAHHVVLLTPDGSACGDVCWGGENQRGTVSVEMTGAACALVEAGFDHDVAWSQVREMLDTIAAKITRVDVAHDDYKGERGLELAKELYDLGEFVTGGRPPASNVQGWNDGSGMTMYIGKPTGRSQLVVYEKGREQGYRDGEEYAEWVRWEGRFYHRKGYEIPLDVLVEPALFLVGRYPALSWVSAVMCRIKSSVVRAKANLQNAMRHCKRQYGGLLNYLACIADDTTDLGDLVSSFLTRDATPKWVGENPFGRAVALDAHPFAAPF